VKQAARQRGRYSQEYRLIVIDYETARFSRQI
jgi:hypothetical protein